MYHVEVRLSACPSSLTMGKAGWPDHGYTFMSDHMRGGRSAAALVLAWCVLLLATLSFWSSGTRGNSPEQH